MGAISEQKDCCKWPLIYFLNCFSFRFLIRCSSTRITGPWSGMPIIMCWMNRLNRLHTLCLLHSWWMLMEILIPRDSSGWCQGGKIARMSNLFLSWDMWLMVFCLNLINNTSVAQCWAPAPGVVLWGCINNWFKFNIQVEEGVEWGYVWSQIDWRQEYSKICGFFPGIWQMLKALSINLCNCSCEKESK